MSSALPNPDAGCCLTPCDDVVVQNIPGPAGDAGINGLDGADGISAITTLTVAFTMPAELGSAAANVVSTAGMVIGEPVYVQTLGTLQVTAIGSSTQATLKNLEDAATSAYSGNAAPGTIAPIGARVGPTGQQGAAGLLSGGAAGGQLKGTYPNPKLAIPNSLGAIIAGDGADAASLSAGTDGQIPAYDAAQPLGILPKSIIPVTGGTNVAADRLVRLSSAVGLPIALGASKASLKDPGGAGVVVADASAGNARGTDAVDLQVNRPSVGATAVASGQQAVIVGGQDNIASAVRSVVVGGEKNVASGQESFVGGGDSNTVDSTQSTIAGGDTNIISGGAANESFIGGGRLNAITGNGQATIAGGLSNSVSGQYGSSLSGFTNAVSADYGVIAGGSSNIVSGQYASVLGGGSNTASGFSSAIIGGSTALADKYGQRAFAAGRFAAQGDCQQSDLIWRIITTDATANVEMFLDGNSLRATIATGKTWGFDILVTGRSSAGVAALWNIKGAINNNAGTTALVAAVSNTVVADGTGATWGVAGSVTVDADNSNDALRIRVTGAAVTTIRWQAHARITEVGHGS